MFFTTFCTFATQSSSMSTIIVAPIIITSSVYFDLFKGEVHCRSIFSGLKEGVELSIKQFLLFSRTPPSLRKQPRKILSCTPSSQIMTEMEEDCSQIATEKEELYSQFVTQMKNLTRSQLCRGRTLLVVCEGKKENRS